MARSRATVGTAVVGRGPRGGPAKDLERTVRVVVDVKVKVDTDPFKEVVVERDEANFDGHLQILESSKLFQQIGDFLMNSLCLPNHET